MSGCRTSTGVAKVPSADRNLIILVPGFKASVLADENQRTVWITAAEGLYGKSSLTLPNHAAGIANQRLHSTGILKRVTVIPGIFGYDIYQRFLRLLNEDFPSSEIVEFHYDWREDNMHHVQALAALVERERRRGVSSISLIGHSMGGLIVSHYLRYGDQDPEEATETWKGAESVAKVVLAGVPFLGATEILRDMQWGFSTGRNANLLSAEALSSFPASYQLLPAYRDGVISNLPFDVFDVDNWKENEWGLLSDGRGLAQEFYQARIDFTQTQLSRARRLVDLRIAPLSHAPAHRPRLLNIVGTGRETPGKMQWKTDTKGIDFHHIGSEDGDSVVTSASAGLPDALGEAFETTLITATSEHSQLLPDEKAYPAIKKFLQRSN